MTARLRHVALVVILLLTAGCLSTSAGAPSTTATHSATDAGAGIHGTSPSQTASTPTGWGTPSFPDWNPPSEAFDRVTIGNASRSEDASHTYTIWNHDDEARVIHVRIEQNTSVIRDRSVRFPAKGVFTLKLATPATYTITVGVTGTNRSRRFTIAATSFTCNAKGVDVAVMEGGHVRSRAFQTLLECTTVTVEPPSDD